MSSVSAQGITVPFTPGGVFYPQFGSRIPALRSFRLTFADQRDRDLNLVQTLVGGDSIDLTPGASLNPANIPDGRLEVAFQDASPAGDEFGYFVSHSLLPQAFDNGVRRFQIRDVGCVNDCSRPLPAEVFSSNNPFGAPANNFILALVGFKMFFIGSRDRELDRIGVWFDDRTLNIALRDRNGNDTFAYLVDFVSIPVGGQVGGFNFGTFTQQGTTDTVGTIPFDRAIPARDDLLMTGWEFNFAGNIDREILDLGVVAGRTNFSVIYSDTSGGEDFSWRVQWAHIGPQVLAPIN